MTDRSDDEKKPEMVPRKGPEMLRGMEVRCLDLDLAAIALKGSLDDGDPVKVCECASDGRSPPMLVVETDDLGHRYRMDLMVVASRIVGDYPPPPGAQLVSLSTEVVGSDSDGYAVKVTGAPIKERTD